MLTKGDKKFVLDCIKSNNEILVKEIIELFTVTNKRIDSVNEDVNGKIDTVSEDIKDINDKMDKILDYYGADHRRINKIEEKYLLQLHSPDKEVVV